MFPSLIFSDLPSDLKHESSGPETAEASLERRWEEARLRRRRIQYWNRN